MCKKYKVDVTTPGLLYKTNMLQQSNNAILSQSTFPSEEQWPKAQKVTPVLQDETVPTPKANI